MNKAKYKLLILILGLAILLGVFWELIPLKDASGRLDNIPEKGFGFQTKEVSLTVLEKKFYANVTFKKLLLKINKDLFMMTLIDGSKDRNLVHDPLYCFRGAGWNAIKTENINIDGGNARHIELKKNNEVKNVIYWFSDGGNKYHSIIKYWLSTTIRRISFGLTGEEPILIIIQVLYKNSMELNNSIREIGNIIN